jgi:hypothetical protein
LLNTKGMVPDTTYLHFRYLASLSDGKKSIIGYKNESYKVQINSGWNNILFCSTS